MDHIRHHAFTLITKTQRVVTPNAYALQTNRNMESNSFGSFYAAYPLAGTALTFIMITIFVFFLICCWRVCCSEEVRYKDVHVEAEAGRSPVVARPLVDTRPRQYHATRTRTVAEVQQPMYRAPTYEPYVPYERLAAARQEPRFVVPALPRTAATLPQEPRIATRVVTRTQRVCAPRTAKVKKGKSRVADQVDQENRVPLKEVRRVLIPLGFSGKMSYDQHGTLHTFKMCASKEEAYREARATGRGKKRSFMHLIRSAMNIIIMLINVIPFAGR